MLCLQRPKFTSTPGRVVLVAVYRLMLGNWAPMFDGVSRVIALGWAGHWLPFRSQSPRLDAVRGSGWARR